MICKKCGHVLPDGSKFCSACGEAVTIQVGDDAKPERTNAANECPICGAEIKPGYLFCKYCRAPLTGGVSLEAEEKNKNPRTFVCSEKEEDLNTSSTKILRDEHRAKKDYGTSVSKAKKSFLVPLLLSLVFVVVVIIALLTGPLRKKELNEQVITPEASSNDSSSVNTDTSYADSSLTDKPVSSSNTKSEETLQEKQSVGIVDNSDDSVQDEDRVNAEIEKTVNSIDEWLRDQVDKSDEELFEEYTDNEKLIAYIDNSELVRIDAFPDLSYSLYRSFFYRNDELIAAVYYDEDDTENHKFYLEDGLLICMASYNYESEQYEYSFSSEEWGKWPGYLYSHNETFLEEARQLVNSETNTGSEEDSNDSDFVLPNSSSEYISMDDLTGLTQYECRIARNEVYARHGRKFKDESLREYFNQFAWYEPTIEPDDFNDQTMLSELERKNLDLILEFERIQGYR